jgi:hypothetical protein
MLAFLAVAHFLYGRGGSDFLAFWLAGREVWGGDPAHAYDIAHTANAQRALGFRNVSPFLSPPPFLALVAPFALAPYIVALGAWLGLTYAAFAGALATLAPRRLLWPAMAFPAVLVCGMAGQTGLLTAALIIGSLGALGARRTVLAGILIGCLVIKPHLAVLFPFALAARGHWRAFGAAAVTAVLLVAGSAALFGLDAFTAYFAQSSRMAAILLTPDSPLAGKLQSVLGLFLSLGATPSLAWTAQGVAALTAIGLTVRSWRSDADILQRGAVLCAAIPLATPYVFAYDLPLLIVPLLWLAREAIQRGFRPGERVGLVAIALLPALAYAATGLLILTPLICALLLALVLSPRPIGTPHRPTSYYRLGSSG